MGGASIDLRELALLAETGSQAQFHNSMIEVALLQRFVLLLGHPVYSLTVTLFSLLLGTGAGSLISQRIGDAQLLRRVEFVILAIVAVAILGIVALPPIIVFAISASHTARIALAVALIAPAGVLLGMACGDALGAGDEFRVGHAKRAARMDHQFGRRLDECSVALCGRELRTGEQSAHQRLHVVLAATKRIGEARDEGAVRLNADKFLRHLGRDESCGGRLREDAVDDSLCIERSSCWSEKGRSDERRRRTSRPLPARGPRMATAPELPDVGE